MFFTVVLALVGFVLLMAYALGPVIVVIAAGVLISVFVLGYIGDRIMYW
jgi:hypothetical protein